jgi:predicted nuclease with TOPRIM domain
MRKQIIDDIAESLGRIYELLNANIKVQEKIIKSNEDSRSPFDSSDESLALLEYSKGYLEDVFTKLGEL